jgi:DNA ligase (NAD+)
MYSQNEKLYLDAKKAYYEGNPIMTDTQFDRLEETLRNEGSSVIHIVGHNESTKNVKHISPMLSLQKIQVNDLSDKSQPIQKFNDWIRKSTNQKVILAGEPKFDGSSCNLIFENNKLISASTRGNGIEGTDITNKISLIAPTKTHFNYAGKIEVRGEVIIKTKTFNDKYSNDYKNPRNFVAGILGRDEVNVDIINDFEFIAFEYRIHTNTIVHGDKPIETLAAQGFTTPPFYKTFEPKDFESIFNEFHQYRIHQSEYGLDGFVIKFPNDLRNGIGETDHHPKWAMAIKFPPTEAITYIKRIQWNLGQSGEFKPIGVLEPIDLDGTTVQNVALHNIGNIQKQGLFPGAKVIIVKSGDIIPIVREVIEPKFNENVNDHIPHQCSTPECKIEIQGVHLVCTNPNCKEQLISKLAAGIGTFGLENVGGATIDKLYHAGIKQISDLFDKSKFNENKLIESGQFKKGRALEIVMESFNKRKPITMTRLIASLAFKNVGWSTSEEIAKIFEGQQPNWSGKSQSAYSPFLNTNSEEYKLVEAFINVIKSNGYQIESENKPIISADSIKFEMTGSPKEFGFKTKDEFIKLVSSHGFVQTTLSKDSNYLITDDIESDSSKMAKARKLNVTIVTYGDIVNMLKK